MSEVSEVVEVSAVIEATKLHKRFGDNVALDGASFSVTRGERVGFLGRNGAGKTTLLRIVAGFLHPDQGSCKAFGVDVAKDPARAQRSIGFLPEGAPAYPEMRAADYLTMRGELKGLTRSEARETAARRLDDVGLGDRARSAVQTLSRGMRQRLGLADALLGDPQLLILDEPTSGLDPAQLRSLTATVGELADERALIFASHRLDAVGSLCDRLVVLARGRVVFDGPTTELAELDDKGDLEAAFLTVTESAAS